MRQQKKNKLNALAGRGIENFKVVEEEDCKVDHLALKNFNTILLLSNWGSVKILVGMANAM